jgi:hypothetical protein
MNSACPMLKQNEGSLDRMIRLIVGVIAFLVGMFMLTGVAQTIVLIISAIALVTGTVGFCGLYALLGKSTCKVKKTTE